MLKDFLKAYTVVVLIATIITTALWIVGAGSPAMQLAIGTTLTFGVSLSVAYALVNESNR